MGIRLCEFLDNITVDDFYFINVKQDGASLYYGYNDSMPEELGNLIVNTVYIDFESDALGIEVYSY